MRDIRKIILLLAVVAILIAVVTELRADTDKDIGAQKEDQPIQVGPATLVEDPVESVQTVAPEKDAVTSAYTEEELEILAIIIYQEAGADYCSDDTRRKVGSVFLNRVKSPLYPDTFIEVALQRRQYGALYRTGLKWPDRAANVYEAHAVKRAYTIAEELLTGGSILPDNVIFQAEFAQGDGLYCYQDGTYFCYKEMNR